MDYNGSVRKGSDLSVGRHKTLKIETGWNVAVQSLTVRGSCSEIYLMNH